MKKNKKNEKKIKIIIDKIINSILNNIIFLNSKNKNLIIKSIIIIIIIFYIIKYFLDKKELKNKNKSELKFFIKWILNFISYSQFNEDLILFCIFYDVKKGFYIDVGANDPNHISVTKAFYLKGWHGINLESLPDKYKILSRERKRDLNLQIGVRNKKGNFSLFAKGGASTLSKIYKKNNSENTKY